MRKYVRTQKWKQNHGAAIFLGPLLCADKHGLSFQRPPRGMGQALLTLTESWSLTGLQPRTKGELEVNYNGSCLSAGKSKWGKGPREVAITSADQTQNIHVLPKTLSLKFNDVSALITFVLF